MIQLRSDQLPLLISVGGDILLKAINVSLKVRHNLDAATEFFVPRVKVKSSEYRKCGLAVDVFHPGYDVLTKGSC